ncbi:MAG: pyridoxal phosphate-dependent aminotransferase [Acidobacteria bacterium]|nr:pyridoxal phosphate-dependent aminotransferase [Acidobacteriota bacterium]
MPPFSRRTAWPAIPNRLALAVEAAKAAGARILDLSESNPTRCGLGYDEKAILDAFSNPAILTYAPEPSGLMVAREAVAAYYGERGTCVGAGDIVLTSSTSEAYSFLFRLLCDPGDEVLAPAPSYPLFEFLADLDDVNLAPYRLAYHDGWEIDFDSLNSALGPRTRAIVVVHPNNPTGSYVKEWEARQLGELCAERGLALVSDEVFLDYAHGGSAAARSLATDSAVPTFALSGLSKISALPQMKAAWMVASGPKDAKAAALKRLEIIADTFLSVSTPTQLALPRLLEQRRTMVPRLLDRIKRNLQALDSALSGHPTLRRLRIEGGWYAVLRVPATRCDEDVAVEVLDKQHVLLHPGHFYDFPRDGYLVLSLITPEEVFSEGVQRGLKALAGC